jgi:hypothetical protein
LALAEPIEAFDDRAHRRYRLGHRSPATCEERPEEKMPQDAGPPEAGRLHGSGGGVR